MLRDSNVNSCALANKSDLAVLYASSIGVQLIYIGNTPVYALARTASQPLGLGHDLISAGEEDALELIKLNRASKGTVLWAFTQLTGDRDFQFLEQNQNFGCEQRSKSIRGSIAKWLGHKVTQLALNRDINSQID